MAHMAADDAAYTAYKKKADDMCPDEPCNNSIRLERYYKIAKQQLMQGNMYLKNRDYFHAYVFLKRFAKLCLKTIPAHTAYNSKVYQTDKNWSQREVAKVVGALESTKSSMQADFFERRERGRAAAAAHAAAAAKSAAAAGAAAAARRDADAAAAAAAAGAGAVPVVPPGDNYAEGGAGGSGGDVSSKLASLKVAKAPTGPSLVDGKAAGGLYPGVRRSGGGVDSGAAVLGGFDDPSALASGPRQVVVPRGLLSQFLEIAKPNTERAPYGIETCGVLAGSVEAGTGRLVVSTVVIPKQEGGPDTCSMTNETELFDFCMANDLLTLGWIHTHPRQECFMSSVDLHTHCGFQTMLQEAIAIVLAPTDTRLPAGVFRLTAPRGLELIQRCDLSGFHPHKEGGIYEHSNHVIFDDVPLLVQDLR